MMSNMWSICIAVMVDCPFTIVRGRDRWRDKKCGRRAEISTERSIAYKIHSLHLLFGSIRMSCTNVFILQVFPVLWEWYIDVEAINTRCLHDKKKVDTSKLKVKMEAIIDINIRFEDIRNHQHVHKYKSIVRVLYTEHNTE